MTPFLKELAEIFFDKYGASLKDFCFVTPNKRSGTFLENYFSKAFESSASASDEVFILPKIITITDFVTELSDKVVNTRIDSLFTLFNLYSKRENADIDFDRFRIWGEIALNDFNDVEMFCVDADQLFKNLENLNEINTYYLTEEQKEVVETYFPSGMGRHDGKSFWSHFNNGSDTGRKYLRLWETMGSLFKELREDLENRGLCLSGGAYRLALKKIKKKGVDALPYRQVVFVGFNALTTVEYRIFKEIKKLTVNIDGNKESLGDFYWDAAGEILEGDSYAAHFMNKNRKHFPSKFRLDVSSNVSGFPKYTKIIACPGNTIQSKVVSEILRDIYKNDEEIVKLADGVAVAMPDENLFFPMLYSLPSELKEVNITMGYPLKITSTYSWMRLLRTLHLHSRVEFGEIAFLRQDLLPLFTHPITRTMIGSDVSQWLCESIRNERTFMVRRSDILSYMACENIHDLDTRVEKLDRLNKRKRSEADKSLWMILRPISEMNGVSELCNHIIEIISLIISSISDESTSDDTSLLKSQIEVDNLLTYSEAVTRFMDAAILHKISMSHISAFSLINQLLASERITLKGEPLSGVQIMGMLETRSLDFENVIITSMNERVFPRRLRNRSFIPNSLRKDSGMATTRFQESIFAYYFYRMISRARNLYLLYDSRSGGLRSGDPSRYIYQLRYLYSDKANIVNQTKRISVVSGIRQTIEGEKTPEVKQKLLRYLDKNSGMTLSATALKKYLVCPLQFYFHYIKGIKVKEEETEAMSAALVGTIFHDTMNDIYRSALSEAGESIVVTKDMIDEWLRPDPSGLSPAARKLKSNIVLKYLHAEESDNLDLEGFASLYFDPIYYYVKNTLETDRSYAPFEYIEGEQERITTFPIDDEGNEISFKYIIDRIDKVDGKMRIVDYKTGGDKIDFKSVQDVISDRHAIMQLMLYASLFDKETGNSDPLKLCIAKPALLGKKGVGYDIMYKDEIYDNHLQLKSEFEKEMRDLLKEIFISDTPFRQIKNMNERSGPCSYCNFLGICKMKNISGN